VALAGVEEASRIVVVELLVPLPGAAVAAELAGMLEDLELQWVGLDPRSPSSTLAEPLKARSVRVKLADTIGVAQAHGGFSDLLTAGRLRVRGHRALDEAVQHASSRKLAGAVAVDRYGAPADMAPLMAAQLAVWAVGDPDGMFAEPGAWMV
jgi:hypothetical protein